MERFRFLASLFDFNFASSFGALSDPLSFDCHVLETIGVLRPTWILVRSKRSECLTPRTPGPAISYRYARLRMLRITHITRLRSSQESKTVLIDKLIFCLSHTDGIIPRLYYLPFYGRHRKLKSTSPRCRDSDQASSFDSRNMRCPCQLVVH